MRRDKLKVWRLLICLLLFIMLFFYYQNNALQISYYTFTSESIPESFDEYKIVHLSDLHSKRFLINQSSLVKKVSNLEPDIILFTGDLVDQKRYNEENSIMLMQQLVDIAPVYYVTGNHEWWSGKFSSLEKKLIETGVHVLRNKYEQIFVQDDSIHLFGIDDPAAEKRLDSEYEVTKAALLSSLRGVEEENIFKILLAHRPEHFLLYEEFGFELIFSGHAHGGQFNIPFIGGIIAPNQGLFPTYVSGEYTEENSTMIVNRGLGNSIIPIRVFNRPEIGVITLILV